MKITVIGPNLQDQSHGCFHAHKAGCRDITGRKYLGTDTPWTVEADSRQEVVEAIYCDIMDENGHTWEEGGYEDDVYFLPCCDNLPRTIEAGVQ